MPDCSVADTTSHASGTFVSDDKLLQPLETLLSSVLARLPEHGPGHVGVALSGGPDSSALAVCAAQLARQRQFKITLLHIHHGLMPQADDWTQHVRTLASLLDLPLVERFVQVDLTKSRGLEGAAREARHQALQMMAQEHRIDTVLFAHHLQDQAETVLQRLLRGAGVLGLGAMQAAKFVAFPQVSDAVAKGCWWLRPWLGVPRTRILQCMAAFEAATGWKSIEDPSNLDPAYARGVIRSQLADPLSAHWPAWASNLARYADLAQEAAELLTEYGCLLLKQVTTQQEPGVPAVLDLRRWRALTPSQQTLVIRTWIAGAGAQMPTQNRLKELCRQLNQVHAYGHDRDLFWKQNDCEIKCSRGSIYLQVTIIGFGSASGSGSA